MEGTGVKPAGRAGASFFNSPGRKKLAGETLWLALMPLQPAPASGSAANRDSHRNFQLNLTCRV